MKNSFLGTDMYVQNLLKNFGAMFNLERYSVECVKKYFATLVTYKDPFIILRYNIDFVMSFHMCMCIYMCVCVYVYVCICVCVYM